MKKVRMRDITSDEYVEGFKKGMELASQICKDAGYELVSPDVDDICVERSKNER